jgi:Heterokaryon incompatibility protein (HET)
MVTCFRLASYLSNHARTNLSIAEDPAADYVSNRPVGQPKYKSLDLARRWIDDCLQSHEHCPGPEMPVLPTRVIDVGAEDGDDPKLVLSQGQRGWYAALSYCWGGPQPFTLTLETMESKLQGISVSKIPETFENAICVARLLNIQYLWIDALCIIQDSDVDKAVEMATMDQVYHNATVTIAAANVEGCSDSFLRKWLPRSYPDQFQLATIDFPCPNGKTGNILVEHGRGYSPKEEPLSKRGWALQERLLSPRVLTFGMHQMWWHCQTALHSEGGAYSDDFVGLGQNMDRLGYDFFQQKGKSPRSTGSNELYEYWRYLVSNYSELHLTVRTDTLPALSGIATRFATVLNDTYCAGLWKNDLLRCLAWYTGHYEEGLVRRSSEYRAPTWSWASIDTGVGWDLRKDKPKMDLLIPTEVLHCQVEPLYSMAPFGEVRAGTVELRGLVRDLDWDGGVELLDADGDLLVKALPDVTVETLNVDADGQGQQQVDFHMGQYEKGVNAIVRRVSCIPVTDHFSLILERQRDGKYVRLGVLDFYFVDDIESRSQAWVEGFYEDATERTVVIR